MWATFEGWEYIKIIHFFLIQERALYKFGIIILLLHKQLQVNLNILYTITEVEEIH